MKRPSDEDSALFREWLREVKRLPARATASEAGPAQPRRKGRVRIPPTAPAAARARSAPLAVGDPLLFTRAGVSRSELRELRRGRTRVEDVLDLHGFGAARAERALRDFLGEARQRGLACIRIVHGKGLHSGEEGPVLKNLVDATLRSTRAVRAFASARAAHGGAGAVNVLLER